MATCTTQSSRPQKTTVLTSTLYGPELSAAGTCSAQQAGLRHPPLCGIALKGPFRSVAKTVEEMLGRGFFHRHVATAGVHHAVGSVKAVPVLVLRRCTGWHNLNHSVSKPQRRREWTVVASTGGDAERDQGGHARTVVSVHQNVHVWHVPMSLPPVRREAAGAIRQAFDHLRAVTRGMRATGVTAPLRWGGGDAHLTTILFPAHTFVCETWMFDMPAPGRVLCGGNRTRRTGAWCKRARVPKALAWFSTAESHIASARPFAGLSGR